MKNLLTSFVVVCFFLISNSVSAFDHTHQEFTLILQEVVKLKSNRTVVDYQKLKDGPAKLDHYLSTLEKVSLTEFDTFTQEQKLAFLINAYNGFTLKLVTLNYPVSSIKKIGGLSGPWKIRFIELLGEKRHLDDIEHNMIRKWFQEPRIHFAVNCASIGCPDLSQVAYEDVNLDQQLEEAASSFLGNQTLNRLSKSGKTLEVSSIFNWFKKDFVTSHGSLPNFLVQYLPLAQAEKQQVLSGEIGIKYLEYDWSLNNQ